MTTWWSPSLVFQSLEVSNLEFLYCALAKVWPPKNGEWNSDIEGIFNFYKKTGLASMMFSCVSCGIYVGVYVYPNDTVVVVKGGSMICCFRIFTASFQALDLLLWQAAHLQHTTLQATSRTRSGWYRWLENMVFRFGGGEECPWLEKVRLFPWKVWSSLPTFLSWKFGGIPLLAGGIPGIKT